MNDVIPAPPIWRVFAAFAVAPVLPAYILAGFEPLYGRAEVFRLYLLIGAYPLAFFFGMPAYTFLRNSGRPTPLSCVIVGAIIPTLPWLFIGLLMALPSSPSGYAYANGHVLRENGHITLWGLCEWAQWLGPLVLVGSLAGIIFWIVAAAGRKRPAAPGHGLDTNSI